MFNITLPYLSLFFCLPALACTDFRVIGVSGPVNRGGDIITRQLFWDFERALHYKLMNSANMGVKYLVSELRDFPGKSTLNGRQFQLTDDYKHKTVVRGVQKPVPVLRFIVCTKEQTAEAEGKSEA